jgi:TnpA family transposase
MTDRTPTGDLRERLREALIATASQQAHEKGIKLSTFTKTTIRANAEALADAVLHVVEHDILAAEVDTAQRMQADIDRERQRAEEAERLAARYRMQVDDPDSLLTALDEAERQRDEAVAALTTHAAKAHRRKWAHSEDNQAAFDALHRLGDDILASRDRLLAALKPKETR